MMQIFSVFYKPPKRRTAIQTSVKEKNDLKKSCNDLDSLEEIITGLLVNTHVHTSLAWCKGT